MIATLTLLPDEQQILRTALEQYRFEVLTQCPRLSDEQYHQEALVIRRARAGELVPRDGLAAQERIAQGCLWLVQVLACRCARRMGLSTTVELLDLIQVGNLALIRATQTFGYEDEVHQEHHAPARAFVKYLCKCVRGAMIRAFYTTAFSLRLPSEKKTRQRLRQEEGQWEQLCTNWQSLDACDFREGPLSERLLAPELILSTNPEQCPEHKATFLALLLSELPPQQRRVLQLRYGLGEGGTCQSVKDITALLGVSEQAINGSERAAMERLRAIYTDYEQETGRTSPYLCYDEDLHVYLEQRRMARAQTRDPRSVVVNAKAAEALRVLEASGARITGNTLAEAAGICQRSALRFLRQRGYHSIQSELGKGKESCTRPIRNGSER